MSMTPYDDTELDPMEALFGTASTEDTETAPPALEAAPPAEDGTVEDALSEAEATGEDAAPPAAGDAAPGSLPDDAGQETEPTLPEAGASPEEPPAEPEPPPRRRRTSRKKAAEASAEPLEPEPDYEAGPMAGSEAEGEREAEGSGDTGIAGGDSGGGSAQATPVPSGDGEAAPPAVPEAAVMPRPRENRPAGGHAPLMTLDLRQLDRDLSREEREEWNEVYASYRSKSLITGKIIGVDEHAFHVRDKQTGALERRRLYCAVVISYRVKVLIPETEFWAPGEERPSHVLRNMTGAEIDYIILDVDREGGVAVASRRMGAAARRHRFDTARGGHSIGDRLTCRVLSVGPSRCLLECGGRDMTLGYRDMSYTNIRDLREVYRPGQTLDCVLTAYDRASGEIGISVREAETNPFEGAEIRHPLRSRRQATISGKYAGGVFCTLPDGTTCLCLYTPQHTDRDFHIGDSVILTITRFDYEHGLIYGRILSKW